MLLLILPAIFCGCSVVNMFKGPGDYNRNHYAQDTQMIYDMEIERESLKQSGPQGHIQKPYSWDLWNEHWNSIIYYLLRDGFPDDYVGPTPKEFVEYIISEREKLGLQPLEYNERTKLVIEQVAGGDATR